MRHAGDCRFCGEWACVAVLDCARQPESRGTHSFPLSTYSAPGDLRQDPGRAAESSAEARTYGNGSREMRVLLSTYGSRGDVEPLVGLAVQLRVTAFGGHCCL
jgi:hypothetical protein